MSRGRQVIIGRIAGVFGLRGWVKVFSHTEPRAGVVSYDPWQVKVGGEWREYRVLEGQAHGNGVIVHLAGVDDRDAAAALVGADIAVERAQLPATGKDEVYWTDLEGLRVETEDGRELGRISHLFETGANDVMVVVGERERLIPYLKGSVIRQVDLEAGVVRVDWDPEF